MAVTRFWRLSQRWLPSCTICFSLLAVSVRFSRASRRYCLLMSSSCVSLSWICRWKACGPGRGASVPQLQGARTPPSRPQATCLKGPSPNERHEFLASPILLMLPENSLSRSWPGGWHKPVMPCKAAGAVDADWEALTRAGEACHSWEDPVAIPAPSVSPVLWSTGWMGRWGGGGWVFTSNLFSSSLATVYNTSEEFGQAAVLSAALSQSSKRE